MIGTFAGAAIGLLISRWPKFFGVGVAITLIAVGLALIQPEFRGAHRSVLLPEGKRFNISFLVLSLGVLGLYSFNKVSTLRILWFSCFGVLLLLRCFSLVVLFAWASFPTWQLLFGLHRRYAAILVFCVLAACLLGSSNRQRRLLEFTSGASYHTSQIRRTLRELSWTPSQNGAQVSLPAARTDLALLHMARMLGIGAAVVHSLLFALASIAGFGGIKEVTRLIAASMLGHVAVCTSLIPAIGMPAPFLGAGGSQWMAFSILLTCSLCKEAKEILPSQTNSYETTPRVYQTDLRV